VIEGFMPANYLNPEEFVVLITFRNIFFLLLLASVFAATGVQAADIPMRGPIPFEAFDKDGNKMISPQEFVAAHNMRIKMRADVNRPSGRMVRSFTYFDANGDNLISADELNAGRGGCMQQQRGGIRPYGPRGRPPGMGRGMNQARQAPDFASFDLNSDGVLMEEEFYKARGQRMRERTEQGYPMRNAANAPAFGRIDTNRDGKVTQQEFADHQVMHQQMRRGQN
jgi:Ca2+-binding EF-hand superfamily protein